MATPIIVPVHTQRDCIVVEGKKYCQSGDISGAEVAAIFVGLLLFAGLLWGAGKVMHMRSEYGSFHGETMQDIGAIIAVGVVGFGVLAGCIWAVHSMVTS